MTRKACGSTIRLGEEEKMRLAAVLTVIFIATICSAASTDTYEIKSMVQSKKDSCAQIAFKETLAMIDKADGAYMSGNMQDVDRVMDNIYETYHHNEIYYLNLKGESECLRNILADIKAKMLQIDSIDDKNNIDDLLRSANVKLNMCDIEGAHSIITDLRNKLDK